VVALPADAVGVEPRGQRGELSVEHRGPDEGLERVDDDDGDEDAYQDALPPESQLRDADHEEHRTGGSHQDKLRAAPQQPGEWRQRAEPRRPAPGGDGDEDEACQDAPGGANASRDRERSTPAATAVSATNATARVSIQGSTGWSGSDSALTPTPPS
jgi:hypothetical protein